MTASSTDKLIRFGIPAAVLTVAGIAAVVSFIHIQHLADTHGQTKLAAVLLPLSIDGTVVAASLVLLRAARTGISAPWTAQPLLWSAVVATLAANVAYGWGWGVLGAVGSGWPAYAFIGCAETAILMARKTAKPVPKRVPVLRKESVRDIRAKHGVSQATAVKMRDYAAAAVAATKNGHTEGG